MTHDQLQAALSSRPPLPGTNAPCGAGRRRPLTLSALCLGVGLAGCTGSDPGIAFGPNGPVPSVDIASVSTNGAPVGSGAAMRDAAASTPGFDANSQYGGPAQTGGSAPVETVTRVPGASLPPVGDSPAQPEAAPQRMAALPPAPAPTEIAGGTGSSAAGPVSPSTGTAAGTQIQFLPLIGVPQAKAELLARALSDSAAASGVIIRPAADAKTDLRLKGYFSSFNDGDQTTLVYVWDVLDANDQRTHRIQGQVTVPGKADDPWAVVDSTVLAEVAQKTLAEAASLG